MKPEEFSRLAEAGYNRIPVVREVLADLDTPLSTYLKLADGPYSYLFESVSGGEQWGRYSIIGLPCRTRVRISGRTITLERDGQPPEVIEESDPLAWVEAFRLRNRVPQLEHLPRFTGGLVGYFGYEIVQRFEPRLADGDKRDEIGTPEMVLLLSEEVAVFDNLAGRLYLIDHTGKLHVLSPADGQELGSADLGEPVVASPAPAGTPDAAGSAQAEAAESAPPSDEPYIETPRCSTCNECTQINPRMFAYDENQQARIVDVNAGTYRELVEAAESCQVAVIHPGKPKNPNEPGLDELMKRAEPFL